MPWTVRKYKDGYFVVKAEKQANGRYEKIHKNPYETEEQALKHLYAININYYGNV